MRYGRFGFLVTIRNPRPATVTYMGVFHLWFVRLGDPTAQQINMYDTSPESWACGAVYRLCLMLIQSIAW